MPMPCRHGLWLGSLHLIAPRDTPTPTPLCLCAASLAWSAAARWLVVSIVYQYAVCGGLTPETGPVCANPIYDAWYALWTPVIQPALGILMALVSKRARLRVCHRGLSRLLAGACLP